MSVNKLLIELHVEDLEKAESFYGNLGFVVKRKDQNYLVMHSNSQEICFYKMNDKSYFNNNFTGSKTGFRVEIVLMVDDFINVYKKLSKQVKIIHDLQERHWGVKDFRIEDPFGSYLRITETYSG